MDTILPSPLRKGDTIGVISSSSPVASFCPRRLQRGVAELERRGFKVKLGTFAASRYKHTAGTVRQRIADLHAMFADKEVKAIICTIGGYNSNQLLEHIDYDLIRAHPKIFMGYSDSTVLLNAMFVKTGLVTYLGPAVLPQFGEPGGMLPFTWRHFEKVLMLPGDVEIDASGEWTDECVRWDENDDHPRAMYPNEGLKVLRSGSGSGRLIGGNIGSLLLLSGTSFMPSFRGAILCLEEDETETPASIDRLMMHVRHIGALKEIHGMIIGRAHGKQGFSPQDSFEDIILDACEGYSFPIVMNFDFGHTDPMLTLPIGGMCAMDTSGSPLLSISCAHA